MLGRTPESIYYSIAEYLSQFVCGHQRYGIILKQINIFSSIEQNVIPIK